MSRMSSNVRGNGHRALQKPLRKAGKSVLPPAPPSHPSGTNPEDQLAFRQVKSPKPPPPLIMGLIESIKPKIFVLDTNVLMHDPTALFRFEDNGVYLPMMTLEELDGHKKGQSEVARNARQVSRYLDDLMLHSPGSTEDGIPLVLKEISSAGRLYLQDKAFENGLPTTLPSGKADNLILSVVKGLTVQFPSHKVVLVSKDINMRVKARVLGLFTEDYRSDNVLGDSDVLYTGTYELPDKLWTRSKAKAEVWKVGSRTCYRLSGSALDGLVVNQFVHDEVAKPPLHALVQERTGNDVVLRTLCNYGQERHRVWGIAARNREQNFALNLLMDPEIDFVTLAGPAGTGKTLLTMAAALEQILGKDRRYAELIVTRVTVPVGEDIGFLPGNEEEKMKPWMGALEDNLEVLSGKDGSAGEWTRAATSELVLSKIKIKSLNFMRGRTFLNKFVLIDEAQNLTPKQMKTLITRAGPGTKMVCLGNLAQIDTPYLTEGSSGLTYAVDRFKGWAHAGHVLLARGERSRLADYAIEVL